MKRILIRLFNRHQGELLAFFTTMATTDVVAPPTGSRTLEGHFGVDAEFRRPCALAKGDDSRDLNFYRRGTALPTEHLNR